MFSTESISVPTGLVFLAGMATLWRAKIRYTVPMLFCLAWFFNFFIGGASGVFLSDVPSDVATHGSFFVMAHFHYTIMGGLVFAFFAAIYYWVPKMFGVMLNETAGEDPLLDDVHRLQLDLRAALRARPDGYAAPRRHLPLAPAGAQRSGSRSPPSCSARRCWSSSPTSSTRWSIMREPAPANPWDSKSLEWQTPTPVPVENFERPPIIDSDPYDYGVPPSPPRGAAG